jgi:hypothetical protein
MITSTAGKTLICLTKIGVTMPSNGQHLFALVVVAATVATAIGGYK